MRSKYAQIILDARKGMGITQAELANQIGSVVQATVSAWERGHQFPDEKHLKKLCEVLNIDPDSLEKETSEPIGELRKIFLNGSDTTINTEDFEWMRDFIEKSTQPVTFYDLFEVLCRFRARELESS